MIRVLSSAVLAVVLGVGLSAQERAVEQRTKVAMDDAKTVTWTGCLRASKDGFDLTEVSPATSGGHTRKDRPTPSTVMLRPMPGTVDLQKYLDRRVAITGAAEEDVHEDIEVKVETSVEEKSRPDMKTKAKASIDVDPNGHNILVPLSIREISKTCK
jgi:hypothetical protein